MDATKAGDANAAHDAKPSIQRHKLPENSVRYWDFKALGKSDENKLYPSYRSTPLLEQTGGSICVKRG